MGLELRYLLQLLLIITIPETLIVTWFAFQFFGVNADRFVKKLALNALVSSPLLIASLGLSPPALHPFIAFAVLYLSLMLAFRDVDWKSLAFLAVVICILNMLAEYSLFFFSPIYGDVNLVLEGPFYYKMVIWPALALFALVAWHMTKNRRSPGKRAMQYLQHERIIYKRANNSFF